jgi:hypothetical protein
MNHKCRRLCGQCFLIANQLLEPFAARFPLLVQVQSPKDVETLLNCAWLFLGLALIAVWSVCAWHTRACEPNTLLPSRRLQFTALLMLVVLLFPVISLTDDIAMCTAPRDAERALRLHDNVEGLQLPQAVLSSTMAWMDLIASIWRSGPSRPVAQEVSLIVCLTDTRLPIDSRPPPASI